MNKKVIMFVLAILMVASLFYAIVGINMHKTVSKEEIKFHDLQADYFSNSKVIRDSATSNSELSDQLVEIKNYPSELMRLKLIGIGKILTSIYILLFGILIALIMMPVRLGKIVCPKCGKELGLAEAMKHKHKKK